MSRARGVALAAALASLLAAAPAGAREPLDVRVFTRIGDPGQPEPVAIGPDDGRVYVGTNQQELGVPGVPSKIFAFNRAAELRHTYTLRGQPLGRPHGIQGLAFDGDGMLYALDRSATPRVVRLDPKTGKQRTWARFPDLPSCSEAPSGADCSATTTDLPPAPDYAAFDPDGRLYVTDIDQALIWRLGRRGGQPRLWLTDPSFEGPFGPNGIQFDASGTTLMLAVTMTLTSSGLPLAGTLYNVPVLPDGSAGSPEVFWRSGILDAPDGFAIARSGNVYLALAGTSQVALIAPTGDELARVPNPIANAQQEIPFDSPGSVAFLGRRVLVSNHAAISGNRASWALLDVYAGERGLPLNYP